MTNQPHPPKAFLSHSSIDKEFVRSVALQLGRQLCVFDEQTFTTSDDLKRLIVDSLETCTMFVVFASKNSCHSLWCDFEQEEAHWLTLKRHIKKVITVTIDQQTSATDLPEWLRHSLIRPAVSAVSVARELRRQLYAVMANTTHRKDRFIGRGSDQSSLESLLIPTDNEHSPRAILVAGLEGVGRRTLVRHVAQGSLGLKTLVEVPVEEGDSEAELALKLAQHVEQYNTAAGLRRISQEVLQLSPSDAIARFLLNAEIATASGELVVILDRGGMCTEDGLLVDAVRSIIANLEPDGDCYIFLISRRHPKFGDSIRIPTLRLARLSDQDTARLLRLCCSDHNLSLSPSEVSDLTTYLGGYPPSAYFAAQQMRAYGKELLISDKHSLVEFRASVFLAYLKRDKIGTIGSAIISILGSLSPLPLVALVMGVRSGSGETPIAEEAVHGGLRDLIDRAIVEVDPVGLYSIAGPVTAAASRVFGLEMRPEICRAVYDSLSTHLRDVSDEDDREPSGYHEVTLPLLRVQYRAAQLAGVRSDGLTRIINDVMRLADLHFSTRHFERSVELCKEVLKDRPRNTRARSILIRSYAHLEKWDLANGELAEHRRYAARSDVLFLEGFVLRKRSRHRDAIAKYIESMAAGKDDKSILRELAQCYLALNALDDARRHIDMARAKGAMDHHIIDLWVKISLCRRDWDEADRGILTLEKVDASQARFYHRKATLEMLRKNGHLAETYAKKSCSLRLRPLFEELAQLARIQLANGRADDAAQTVERIERLYPGIRTGIACALKCSVFLARSEFGAAYELSTDLPAKDGKYFRGIRRQALLGLLGDVGIDDFMRKRYRIELETLNQESGAGILVERGPAGDLSWFTVEVLALFDVDELDVTGRLSGDGEEEAAPV